MLVHPAGSDGKVVLPSRKAKTYAMSSTLKAGRVALVALADA